MNATVKGQIYTWRDRPTFDQVLCELPETIVILETGQVIARYSHASFGPEIDDDEGGSRLLKAYIPPLPYEDLQILLEEHAQGCLGADELRSRLNTEPSGEENFTEADLQEITRHAVATWGEASVNFEPYMG